MKRFMVAMVALGMGAGTWAGNPVPKACDPRTMGETSEYARYYMNRQNWFMEHKDKIGPNAVVFLGDSITEAFQNTKAYKETFAQDDSREFKALDLGNDGERTENVLWHIESGQLDGYKAKAVVVAIGTNNMSNGYPKEDVWKALEKIIDRIRYHQGDDMPIILQAVFPRGREADNPDRPRVAEYNVGYKRIAAEKKVRYLALWDEFLEKDGTISKETMPDGLHPGERAGRVWVDGLLPILREIDKEQKTKEAAGKGNLLEQAAAKAKAGDYAGAAQCAAAAAGQTGITPTERALAENAALNYYARIGAKTCELKPFRFNSLFGDHAVLQRGQPIPVWGFAKPNAFVTVGLKGVWMTAKATESGAWRVYLPAQEAGGPFELTAVSEGETLVSKDIYIGEVWIAGGQSNMEMPLAGYGDPVPPEDLATLVSKQPIRHIKVSQSEDSADYAVAEDCHAPWQTTWKGNEKTWSATATFFAYSLANKLNVPVGIVLCAFSGSRAEAWLSFGALESMPSTREWAEKYEFADRPWQIVDDNKPGYSKQYGFCDPRYTRIMKDIDGKEKWNLDQPSEGREKPDFDDASWKKTPQPGNWYDKERIGRANGVAWFRKHVEIPADWAGKELSLELGAIDKTDIVYFNGVEVGRMGHGFEWKYWNTPRIYKVPASAVKAGKAVVAVRIVSFSDGGGMWGPADKMRLVGPTGAPIPLSGEWLAKLTVNIDEREGVTRVYRHLPHFFADNMVSAVAPFATRGAIWYQGESNAGRKNYGEVMERVIEEWRARWNQTDFAFLQVVLAGSKWGSNWVDIREMQIAVAKKTGTGVASALDVGHGNIHPPYKRPVGERLALRALSDVYGEDVVSHGPEYKSVKQEGATAVVAFDFADGLKAKGATLGGFELAGKDGRFTKAEATIDGTSVKVTAKGVTEPRQVRYAWSGFPKEANLYNAADLPALPFRAKIGE